MAINDNCTDQCCESKWDRKAVSMTAAEEGVVERRDTGHASSEGDGMKRNRTTTCSVILK